MVNKGSDMDKKKAPRRKRRPTPVALREMRKCRKALGLPLKGAI